MIADTEIQVLAQQGCDALRRLIGTRADIRVCPHADREPSLALAFRPKGGKVERIYAIAAMPTADAAAIARLIRDWKPDVRQLIVAYHMPADLARKLKEAEIPFLDAAGNAYLAEPGFFLLVTGCPPPPGLEMPTPVRPPRLFNPTGLKVLFVLLARPDYVNRPYREIAHAAGVALGTVSGVIRDLERLGYLTDFGKDGKRLRQWEKLIDEWTGAYARQLVRRHAVRHFRAENPGWWKTADLKPFDALWGGDVAADRLTGYLKPGEITVYAKGSPGRLLQAQRMRADPQGDVAIVEAFWNFPPTEAEVDTVPPLLVYADLMSTGDARAVETARLIHERYLVRPDKQA